MKDNKVKTIDRNGWAPGPWDAEPDRVEFTHRGLPCLMVRHPKFGNWCGYAAALPSHPWHGKGHDTVEVDVHGGLTYSKACSGDICHTPKPGEPDNVWWFGFDCGHGLDKKPGMDAMDRAMYERTLPRTLRLGPYRGFAREEYRDMAYVRRQVERLAEQIADAATRQ